MGRDSLTRVAISKLDRKNDSTSSLFVVSKNSGSFLLCSKTCTFFLGVGGQLWMAGILWSLEVGVLHSSWSSTWIFSSSPSSCSWPGDTDCWSFCRFFWVLWSLDMEVNRYGNLQGKRFGGRLLTSGLTTICILVGILPSYLLKINYISHDFLLYFPGFPLNIYLYLVWKAKNDSTSITTTNK